MKPNQPTKLVDIVSIKLVKEGSVATRDGPFTDLDDGYTLMKEFLDGLDREHFLVVSLDPKNQPVSTFTILGVWTRVSSIQERY